MEPKRRVLDRVSRFNLNKGEKEKYNDFVQLISTFPEDTMHDFLECARRDAVDKKGQHK